MIKTFRFKKKLTIYIYHSHSHKQASHVYRTTQLYTIRVTGVLPNSSTWYYGVATMGLLINSVSRPTLLALALELELGSPLLTAVDTDADAVFDR